MMLSVRMMGPFRCTPSTRPPSVTPGRDEEGVVAADHVVRVHHQVEVQSGIRATLPLLVIPRRQAAPA